MIQGRFWVLYLFLISLSNCLLAPAEMCKTELWPFLTILGTRMRAIVANCYRKIVPFFLWLPDVFPSARSHWNCWKNPTTRIADELRRP
jgi:hypothetical protein